VWIPPDAQQVRTREYQLIAYPEDFQHPTEVAWTAAARPAAEVIAEVTAQVRTWGRDRVYWWVRGDTRPADTEATLQERGATLAQTVQVLAYDMTSGVPDLGPASPGAGLRAELVRDEPTLRATHLVAAEVWDDHRERTPAVVAGELADITAALRAWSDFRVVVYCGDEPAAAGGCTLVGEVARLWGAGTRPAFRGRGAYRSLLAARMKLAHERRATLALVKGRVETSGPILRRAGFSSYGEERSYCLMV